MLDWGVGVHVKVELGVAVLITAIVGVEVGLFVAVEVAWDTVIVAPVAVPLKFTPCPFAVPVPVVRLNP